MNKATRTPETLVKPRETGEKYTNPKGGTRPQQHTLVQLMSANSLDQAGLKRLLVITANNTYNYMTLPGDLINTLFHGKPIMWQYAQVVCTAFNMEPEEIFRAVTEADLEKEAIKNDAILGKKRKDNFRRRQARQNFSS